MDTLIAKTKQVIDRYSMLRPDVPIVVMVSGGGDSVALLRLLCSGEFDQLDHVHALHINHMLRAGESDADEVFVRDLCASLDVPLTVGRVDVGAYASSEKLNLEDAGRIIRYEHAESLLDSLCDQLDIHPSLGRIATAHSRDDRVETFFVRALFGAGTGALGSIAATRGRIIRPLIDCDREEIRSWLEAQGVGWREDASNQDTERTRAFVRANIVPACEQLNPAFRESLTRTMNLLADDDALLSSMASMFAHDFVDDSVPGEFVTFNVSFMRTLDRTMARRTLRTALLDIFPESSRLESLHIEALTEAFKSESFVRDLPEGLRAELRCGTLKVSKKREHESCLNQVLDTSGVTDLGPAGFISIEQTDGLIISRDPMVATIDGDLLLGTLSAGPQRAGERITPLGMEGSKKVSDIFVDSKVERELRDLVPIVRDGSTIVWIAGQCVSEQYKVSNKTSYALRMQWTPRVRTTSTDGVDKQQGED